MLRRQYGDCAAVIGKRGMHPIWIVAGKVKWLVVIVGGNVHPGDDIASEVIDVDLIKAIVAKKVIEFSAEDTEPITNGGSVEFDEPVDQQIRQRSERFVIGRGPDASFRVDVPNRIVVVNRCGEKKRAGVVDPCVPESPKVRFGRADKDGSPASHVGRLTEGFYVTAVNEAVDSVHERLYQCERPLRKSQGDRGLAAVKA